MIHIKAFEPEPHYSWLSHFLFKCCTWYCFLPPYNPRIRTWKMSNFSIFCIKRRTFEILRDFCLFPKRAWCSWCIQCHPLFSRSKIMYSFFLDNWWNKESRILKDENLINKSSEIFWKFESERMRCELRNLLAKWPVIKFTVKLFWQTICFASYFHL
jgi:hypothetical protein